LSKIRKHPADRFPAPWHVDETEAGQFVVRDAHGLALAHVYAGNENSKRSDYLTSAEALAIAQAIAELPNISGAKRKRTIHIIPHKQGGWAIRREGSIRATSIHRTLEQAKKAAELLAQKEGVGFVVQSTGETTLSCVVFGTVWPIPPKSFKVKSRQGSLDGERRMIRSRLVAAFLVVLAVVATTGMTLADDDAAEDAAERAALANAKLTLDQAIVAASTAFPGGKVLESEVDTEDGVPSYVIDIEKDGLHSVIIDIRSGAIKTAAMEADDIDTKGGGDDDANEHNDDEDEEDDD
jgi:uncharacterized membrane protein YkoI